MHLLAQFFSLPGDWQAQMMNGSQQITTPSMPLVLIIIGIFLAILAIRFLVGLVHK
jgi:hypothetical protein